MKKLPLVPIMIAVIVILLAGGGGYYFMNMQKGTNPLTGAPTGNSESVFSSLTDLIASGVPQECSFSSNDPEYGSSSGKSYVSGEKIRTDFSSTDPEGNKTDGTMIMDGTYMYTWTNDTKEGMKMKIEETEEIAETEITGAVERPAWMDEAGFDPDEKVDYSCKPWLPNNAMFVPPADVKLVDFSEQMKQIEDIQNMYLPKSEGETGTPSEEDCAVCASLPAEAAAVCKTSMGCE